MEARAGIEPAHKGFADLSLTTWVPRPNASNVARLAGEIQWPVVVPCNGGALLGDWA